MLSRSGVVAVLAFVSAAVLAASAGAQSPSPVKGSWVPIGIGGGGGIQGMAVHPTDPNIAIVTADVGGAYRTTDGGVTWTLTNDHVAQPGLAGIGYGNIIDAAFNPVTPSIVYFSQYKSTDTGAHYAPENMSNFYQLNVVFDPSNANKVYAGSLDGYFYKKVDPSGAWSAPLAMDLCPVGSPPQWVSKRPQINAVVVTIDDPNRILLATSCGLRESTDGGTSFHNYPHLVVGNGFNTILKMVQVSTAGHPLFATVESRVSDYVPGFAWYGGVYKSTDSGSTWTAISGTISSWCLAPGDPTCGPGNPTYYNPDMETETDGNPNTIDDWTLSGAVTRDCTEAFPIAGIGCSMKVTTPSAGATANSISLTVTPGARYVLSERLKMTMRTGGGSLQDILTRLFFYKANGDPAVIPNNNNLNWYSALAANWSEAPNWVYRETEVTVPSDAAKMTISQVAPFIGSTVWIDNVRLQPTNGLSQTGNYTELATDDGTTIYAAAREGYDYYANDPTRTVWRSTDGGASWSKTVRLLYSPNVAFTRAIEHGRLPSIEAQGLAIGHGTVGKQTLYYGTGLWLYKTIDGGSNWSQVDSRIVAGSSPTLYQGGGLNGIGVIQVTLDPRVLNRIYYGDWDNMMLVSRDLDDPNTDPNRPTFRMEGPQSLIDGTDLQLSADAVTSILPDPTDPNANHLYVGFSYSPYKGANCGGCKGSGAGEVTFDPATSNWNWNASSLKPLGTHAGPPSYVDIGAVDLAADTTSSTLYAAQFGSGVFTRAMANPTDAWTMIAPSNFHPTPAGWNAFRIRQSSVGRMMYVALGDPRADCSDVGGSPACDPNIPSIPSGDTGVWVSDLNASPGTNWVRISASGGGGAVASDASGCTGAVTNLANSPVTALLPVGSRMVYVATDSARNTTKGGLFRGVCTSTSCGTSTSTWEWCRLIDQRTVYGVAASPNNPRVLYASVSQGGPFPDVGQQAGLWMSNTFGAPGSWRYVDNDPSQLLENLSQMTVTTWPDRPGVTEPESLYSGNFASGLWQGKVTCNPVVPGSPDVGLQDSDGDTVNNFCDNCPTIANGTQADVNKDGYGDACGPVAAYNFNATSGTTLTDRSPNGNNGTLVNGPTWVAGHDGNALSFDGTNDVVEVASSSSLRLTTGMTIEAWVKPSAAMTWWKAIAQKEVDDYFLNASTNLGFPGTGATFSSCCPEAQDNVPLPTNVWTHIAGTYDGANLRFYVNGVLRATTPQTGNIHTSTTKLRIGGNTYTSPPQPAGHGENFPGLIDDLRIYKRALSVDEIKNDMNTPVP